MLQPLVNVELPPPGWVPVLQGFAAGFVLLLGFAIGGSLDAAAGFLKNFSGLLASLAVLAGSVLLASGVIGRGAADTHSMSGSARRPFKAPCPD